MNKKIVYSSFTVTVLALIASIGLMTGFLFPYFEKQMQKELRSEAGYLSYIIEKEGVSWVEQFDKSEKRITLIDKNGTVLADNFADAASMDNHANRREVKEALKSGSGTSVRYSDTFMERTIYYAKKLENGDILRVAVTWHSVFAILIGLVSPLAAVVLVALLLSLLLARRVSRAILKPINQLDLDNPSANGAVYEELAPLLGKISAQKRTIDEQLREAKQKQEEFRLITENMQEGFLVIDAYTRLLTCNQAAERLLNITEVQKSSVLAVNRSEGFRTVIEHVLSGKRAENTLILGERHYNLIGNPVFEKGEVIGAVLVILDVTESVKREQLRREFTSNVSHELKTPLTSISGFAEILKAGGNQEEAVCDFSASIYEEAQRLITLVNDILKISELDEGNISLKKETVDLCGLSKEILKRLKPGADKKHISLYLTGEYAPVSGVPQILEEMLYNLCDNAIKYNRENGEVHISIQPAKTQTVLTIKDTGIGIPIQDQARVFERFYCVDKSRSKAVGGTGLGLSIVKHAAAYHNAVLSLESKVGVGTSITLRFPGV